MDPSLSSIPINHPAPIPPPPIIPVVNPVVAAAGNPTTVVSGVNGGGGSGLPPGFNHPPYSDMICEAIGALKEKNGSSKRAIAKYIESAYRDLPPTHSALLTHHLKRLKNNGLLVMFKKSYMLATSITRSEAPVAPVASVPQFPDAAPVNSPDVPPGTKRGRGRPPKPKSTLPNADPNLQLQQQLPQQPQQPPLPSQAPPVQLPDGSKRTPGRPRKNGPIVGQLGVKKGRGRPPKTGPKKSPGRPRKPKTVRSVVGANAMKRGRGRPPKALNQFPPQGVMPIQGQPVAVPYADATTAAANVPPISPRPRGRPKAAAGAANAGVGVGLGAGVGGVVPGKRRGRPPKIGGVVAAKPMKPRKSTGKPVGRPPKKTANGAEPNQALAAAYGDLRRKFEFFQSKVKMAVGVLKPQFTSESSISAIGAIQDLEGLAAMDISSAFKDDAQPPPPPPPIVPAATAAMPPIAQPPPPSPMVPQNGGQVY